MAGKVGQKAQVTNGKTDNKAEIVKARQATPEELAAQIAGEAVKQTMKEFMPMFATLLEGVQNQKQTPVQAVVNVQEDLSSIQSRVVRDMNRQFDNRVRDNKQFMEKLANAPVSDYRTITIPRMFKKYFGSQLLVGLNGSVISVAIDGRPHRVHKHFLPIIRTKLDYEDQKIDFMERTDFSDVVEVTDVGSIGT